MAEKAIVRTVTCFCGLSGDSGDRELVARAGKVACNVGIELAKAGFVVQTVRVATNPWEEYCPKIEPDGKGVDDAISTI